MSQSDSMSVTLPSGAIITLTMDKVAWFQIPREERQRLFALIDGVRDLQAKHAPRPVSRETPHEFRQDEAAPDGVCNRCGGNVIEGQHGVVAFNHYRWDSILNPCVACQERLTIEQKRAAYRDMSERRANYYGEDSDEWSGSFAKLGEAIAIGANPVWDPPRNVAEREIYLLVEGAYMTVSLGVSQDLHAFCVSRIKRANRAAPPLYSIRCDSCRTIVNDAVEFPPPGVVAMLANHYAALGRRK